MISLDPESQDRAGNIVLTGPEGDSGPNCEGSGRSTLTASQQ